MKKLRLLFSISTLCFALAVFCFGVFSAISATYSIGGSVTYIVQDVYVTIRTRVYYSKTKATSDIDLLGKSNQLTDNAFLQSSVESGNLVPVAKYNNGILDMNTFTDNRDPAEYPTMSEDTKIAIEYGKNSMSYFIVIEITNIGDNEIWAGTTTYDITENCNTLRSQTSGIDSIVKDETKTIVYGFSLDDEKTSIQDGVTFDYQITISSDMESMVDIDTNPRVESVGKYYIPRYTQAVLSNNVLSKNIDLKPNTEEISESTLFGSIFNFIVPENTSAFSFSFTPKVSFNGETISLTQFENIVQNIKIINNKVTDFSDVYGTGEYNSAPELSFTQDNTCVTVDPVTHISQKNISVVVTYNPIVTVLYGLLKDEGLYITSLIYDINLVGDTIPVVEVGSKSETSIPMQSNTDGSDAMYYFSYILDVPSNSVSVNLSLNVPITVTDNSTQVNILRMIDPIPLKGAYPTYESVISAITSSGNETAWQSQNVIEPTAYNLTDDGLLTTSLPCAGLTNLTLLVAFNLSDEQILELSNKGIDITSSLPCDLNIKYMGVNADDAIQLNGVEYEERSTINKAYIQSSVGDFTFIQSGNYYYQNFYVKNYFDKYDKLYLYLSNVTNDLYVLSGERDQIGSELTDIIASASSNNIVVELTKENAQSFCIVSKDNLAQLSIKPDITKKKYDYEVLEDNTIALSRYWSDGSSTLNIPETIDGHTVSRINKRAIYKNNDILTLTVPDTVVTIEDGGLFCLKIENVTIPFLNSRYAGLVFNDSELFTDETKIPSTLKTIKVTKSGNLAFTAFETAKNLTKIKFADEITSVSIDNLDKFTNITELSLGNKVDKIVLDRGYNSFSTYYASLPCFANNTSNGLTILTARDGQTKYLFGADSSVTNITKEMLAGVRLFVDNSLSECSNLVTLEIPSSLKSIGDYEFSSCSSLTSITFESGSQITSIGDDVFFGCSSLTSVIFESGSQLTSIGKAFLRCSSLTCITIPKGVTSIVDGAFLRHSSLTSVTFESGSQLTSIGSDAFSGCSSLTSITIPSSVTSIGDDAFYDTPWLANLPADSNGLKIVTSSDNANVKFLFGYTGSLAEITAEMLHGVQVIYCFTFVDKTTLQSITIPSSVTSIGKVAFQSCSKLTSVTFESGSQLTSIGDYAFWGCSSLTGITIPSSVTSIGNYAFQSCSSLTSVTFEEGSELTSIGVQAFYNCSSLTSITIPSSVTSIDNTAFNGCSGLESITVSGTGGTYTAQNNCLIKGTELVLGCKTSVIPSSVTSIGDWAFDRCTQLTSVTFEAGSQLTSIGGWAFSGCSNLASITIPSSVTSIGNGAFNGCSSLTSITIPSGVTSIEKNAFWNCKSLTSITIPEGVTSIGSQAFYGCSSLTSIEIPSSVTSIGNSAFSWCSSLTSIEIPSSVTSIGDDAFTYCSSLESITVNGTGGTYTAQNNCLIKGKQLVLGCKNSIIPTDGSVTSIGNSAFSQCSGLTSITIPSSVTSIGASAFYNCSSLTSITIQSSVTSIGNSAFSHCSGLTSITIPSSVTSIGDSAFYWCSSLTSITIPSSVTSIGNSAFYGCSSLTSVTFESGSKLTSIGNNAFRYCSSLTSITISSSVTNIGDFAFDGCYALAEVYDLSSLNITAGNSGYGKVGYYAKAIHTDINEPTRIVKDETNKLYYYVYDTDYILLTCYDETIINATIDSRCTSINKYAFNNCSSLTSITIPSSVTSIGEYAFYYCSSLTSATFEDPNGWSANNTALTLTNTSTNAKYLTSTYKGYTWTKS